MRKMRYFTIILVFMLTFLSIASGCTSVSENTPDKIMIVAPAGAPTVSVLKLMKDYTVDGDTAIVYESVPTTDLLMSRLTNNEADIAIIPTNMAVKLYNKGLSYKLAAVNTWGNLFLAANEDIAGWESLKGKEIYMFGKGLIPDIVFRKLLIENGIDPDTDLTLTYVTGTSEIGPSFISGKSSISLIAEPMLTTVIQKKPDTKIILDMQKEWNKSHESDIGYPQAGVFIKQDLLNNNKTLVSSILAQMKAGTEWLNDNPEKVGEYADELEIGVPGAVISRSLPGSNIHFEYACNVKTMLEDYFKVLLDFSADTIGGKLPDDNFYYEDQQK